MVPHSGCQVTSSLGNPLGIFHHLCPNCAARCNANNSLRHSGIVLPRHASHVYIGRDGYKPHLTCPYKGPYRILGRANKHFTVEVEGEASEVSVNRLKPAKLEAPATCSNSHHATATLSPKVQHPKGPAMQQPRATIYNDKPSAPTTASRSGHLIREPSTLHDYVTDW